MRHAEGLGPKPEPEPVTLESMAMFGDLGQGAFG
jgi:hypothetical protein